jgi:hypothetical protein
MLNESVIQQNLFQRKTTTTTNINGKNYPVVSLFSGCGGMDLGFRGGFSVFGRKYGRTNSIKQLVERIAEILTRIFTAEIFGIL